MAQVTANKPGASGDQNPVGLHSRLRLRDRPSRRLPKHKKVTDSGGVELLQTRCTVERSLRAVAWARGWTHHVDGRYPRKVWCPSEGVAVYPLGEEGAWGGNKYALMGMAEIF